MKFSVWRQATEELLDAIEGELRVSVPNKTKAALNALRSRLNENDVARNRKRFAREMDALLESDPFLRAATVRYFRKEIPRVVSAALETLERAKPYLAKAKKKQTRAASRSYVN
jgi:hypothetical protein